jgi:flagellar basal body P-ring formation protein FlgA
LHGQGHPEPEAPLAVRPPEPPNPLRAIALAIAACCLLLALALLVTRQAHASAPGAQPLDAIRDAAVQALGAGDAQSADAVLDPRLRLAACGQALQAVASGPRTARVRCDDAPGWTLYVPVRIRREAEVVVLGSPAAAGVPIDPAQLVVQRREVGDVVGVPFSDAAALAGRIPSRALAPGVVPTENDLVTGTPLRRGDPVVLVSRTGAVEVRVPGRALGPAQAGGRIAVENASSRRVLRGRVVGDGVVELLP